MYGHSDNLITLFFLENTENPLLTIVRGRSVRWLFLALINISRNTLLLLQIACNFVEQET